MNSLKGDAAAAMTGFSSPRDGELEAVFLLGPQLPVFAGHFPGHSLVPGVLELEMVRVALEKALSCPSFRILSIPATKFLREIKPGEEIKLTAHFIRAASEKEFAVKALLWVGAEKAAQIQMTVEKDG